MTTGTHLLPPNSRFFSKRRTRDTHKPLNTYVNSHTPFPTRTKPLPSTTSLPKLSPTRPTPKTWRHAIWSTRWQEITYILCYARCSPSTQVSTLLYTIPTPTHTCNTLTLLPHHTTPYYNSTSGSLQQPTHTYHNFPYLTRRR
jgi:hypothetical protein